MSITVKNLTYVHADGTELFRDISFHIPPGNTASLVGDNGCGKSTLLDIIAGVRQPSSGRVSVEGDIRTIPQHTGQYDHMTVAELLGITPITDAIARIERGDPDPDLFDTVGQRWDICPRSEEALSRWGLPHIRLSRPVHTMSGGEKTRALLAAIDIHSPRVVVMDEPSNHLDRTGRDMLYDTISRSRATMLLCSHDIELLETVSTTLELSARGITAYGGNYTLYRHSREQKEAAMEHRLHENERKLEQARRTAQRSAERRRKLDSRAEGKAVKGGVPRIMMKTLLNSAEQSSSRLCKKHEGIITGLEAVIKDLESGMQRTKKMRIDVPAPESHHGKPLVYLRDMNHDYGDGPIWRENVELSVFHGERIWLCGDNGSGKTTLLKIATGELTPTTGAALKREIRTLVLDQEYAGAAGTETVLEYAFSLNTNGIEQHILRTELDRFGFGKEELGNRCRDLSGGEKMRLIFCGSLISSGAPDMLVLDEPTNNLDISGLQTVRDLLSGYNGTIIIISHDKNFVSQLGIGKIVEVTRRGVRTL